MLHKYNKKVIKYLIMGINKFILAVLVLALFSGCSSKKISEEDKQVLKKKRNEAPKDLRERVESSTSGGIFTSSIGNKNKAAFAANNVLWRGTLQSLDFVPLSSSDYPGGIIITDWYSSSSSSSGTSVKIVVKFLSNEVNTSSLEVAGYEKNCKNNSPNCSVKKTSENFNLKIKESILTSARNLSLEKDRLKN
jgi:hypothetical protein